MGEMINDEERAGRREPWVGVGGPRMGGCEGRLGHGAHTQSSGAPCSGRGLPGSALWGLPPPLVPSAVLGFTGDDPSSLALPCSGKTGLQKAPWTWRPELALHVRVACPLAGAPAEGRVERHSHVACGRWFQKEKAHRCALVIMLLGASQRVLLSCKRREKLLLHTRHRALFVGREVGRGGRSMSRSVQGHAVWSCSACLGVPPARVSISFCLTSLVSSTALST